MRNPFASVAGTLLIVTVAAGALAAPAAPPSAPSDQLPPDSIHHICGDVVVDDFGATTHEIAACPFASGMCADPANRDAEIPMAGADTITIRLFFNVFREDDGSNPAATAAHVAQLVDVLNQAYAPSAIQFVHDLRFVDDTEFRYITVTDPIPEDDPVFIPMKQMYAVDPQLQCNVYVTQLSPGYSFANGPWEADALTATGGTVLNYVNVLPAYEGRIMTHELGHNFGLLHTFTGVSEFSPCGPCGETPSMSDSARDVTGDFCSDTPPQPVLNGTCVQPTGFDPCFGAPWGVVDTQNYMGYSYSCYEEFTPQQMGRMRCWINDRLTSWISTGEECASDTTFVSTTESDPLGVSYTWISAKDLGSRLGDGTFYNNFAPNPLDDGTSGPHPLPFTTFDFYGQEYSQMYIGVNGALSFNDVDVNINGFYGTTGIPGAPFATLVAPFYNDLLIDTNVDPDAGIYVYQTPDTLVIEWHRLANFNNPSATVTFEVVLTSDGNILFQYQDIESSGLVTQALVGVQNNLCEYVERYEPGGEPSSQVADAGTVWLRNSANEAPCCLTDRGDINSDGTDADPIDLSFLVDFLFASGTAPGCDEEADLNADLAVADPIDLSYLVDFLFASGAAPLVCR